MHRQELLKQTKTSHAVHINSVSNTNILCVYIIIEHYHILKYFKDVTIPFRFTQPIKTMHHRLWCVLKFQTWMNPDLLDWITTGNYS